MFTWIVSGIDIKDEENLYGVKGQSKIKKNPEKTVNRPEEGEKDDGFISTRRTNGRKSRSRRTIQRNPRTFLKG